MRRTYHHGLNKEFHLYFTKGYQLQKTSKKGQTVEQ